MAYLAAAFAFISSIASSQQQADAMRDNARISENNARLIDAQTTEQERRQRAELEQIKARQRVAVAKSGVTMSGTPLLVAEDITGQGELDALTIRYNGTMKANQQRYEAAMQKYQARQTERSGYIKAVGSAFSAYAGAGGFGSTTALGSGISAGSGTGSSLASMGGGTGVTGGINFPKFANG